jgi:hypothetical protein
VPLPCIAPTSLLRRLKESIFGIVRIYDVPPPSVLSILDVVRIYDIPPPLIESIFGVNRIDRGMPLRACVRDRRTGRTTQTAKHNFTGTSGHAGGRDDDHKNNDDDYGIQKCATCASGVVGVGAWNLGREINARVPAERRTKQRCREQRASATARGEVCQRQSPVKATAAHSVAKPRNTQAVREKPRVSLNLRSGTTTNHTAAAAAAAIGFESLGGPDMLSSLWTQGIDRYRFFVIGNSKNDDTHEAEEVQ